MTWGMLTADVPSSEWGEKTKTIKTVPLISINYSPITIFIPGMTRWISMNTEQQNHTFLTETDKSVKIKNENKETN